MAVDFTPRTQPIDPTALISATQNKALVEYQAQEAKRQRRQAAVKDILQAVEQGQTIASNAMKLADERRKQQGIGELSAAFADNTKSVTRVTPAAGPATEAGQPPVSFERTTMGQTPEGQASIKNRLLQAATKVAPENAAKSIFSETFSKPQRGVEQAIPLTLNDGSTIMARFRTDGKGFEGIDGTPLSPEILKQVVNRGYAAGFGTNPITGQPTVQNKSTGTVTDVPIKPEAGKTASSLGLDAIPTKVRREAFQKTVDESFPQSNPIIAKAAGALSSGATVKSILALPGEPNQVALASLGTQFARLNEEVGNLNTMEQQQYKNPLSLIDQVVNKGYNLVAGDFSPEVRQELVQLADTLNRKAELRLKKALALQKNKGKIYAKDAWNSELDSLYPSLEDLKTSSDEFTSTDREPVTKPADTGNKARLTQIDNRIQQIQDLIRKGNRKK